jgi:hypothetical protein
MSRARDFANLAGAADAGTLSGESLIINGAMNVHQRASSVTGVGASTDYSVQDRWKFFTIGAAAARWTQSTSTDVPASSDFTSSLKLDCTTASGSVGDDDRQQLMQIIEAQDLQHLKYGSSDAKKLTLSFWVKSSVTGKNYCWLYHNDGTRFTYKSYTVNAADTWEYKTITFSGDTASAITDDNGAGLNIIWMLYAGADYTGATDGVEDTWAAWSSGNYDQFNGQVNNASSTDNNWYLTGVKLEVGETATSFQHESYAENLAKCQRYYHKVIGTETYQRFGMGMIGSGNARIQYQFPVEMRARPTVDDTGTAGNYGVYNYSSVKTATSTFTQNTAGSGKSSANLYMSASGLTNGDPCAILANNNASAFLAFNAEL